MNNVDYMKLNLFNKIQGLPCGHAFEGSIISHLTIDPHCPHCKLCVNIESILLNEINKSFSSFCPNDKKIFRLILKDSHVGTVSRAIKYSSINPCAIWLSYCSRINQYTKKYFSIDDNNKNITYSILGEDVETSIARLNFAVWFIEMDIVSYIDEYISEIEDYSS